MKRLAHLFEATYNDNHSNWRPAFTLPLRVNKNDFLIVYHFQGRDPNHDVRVEASPWWFLSDENREGLVWPCETDDDETALALPARVPVAPEPAPASTPFPVALTPRAPASTSTRHPVAPASTSTHPHVAPAPAPASATPSVPDNGGNAGQKTDTEAHYGVFGVVSATLNPGILIALLIPPQLRIGIIQ